LAVILIAGMKKVDRQESIDEVRQPGQDPACALLIVCANQHGPAGSMQARMLSQLNHPHVCKHYNSFIDSSDRLNIVMEYASKGNVAQLIRVRHPYVLCAFAAWSEVKI
jgi:serine/threonine protein kinase